MKPPGAPKFRLEGGDRKNSPQIIVAQLPSDPPTKTLVTRTHDNPDPTSGSSHESQQSHLWPKRYLPFAMSHLLMTHFAILYGHPNPVSTLSIPLMPFSLLHTSSRFPISPRTYRAI
jgi:hypothetical protein